MTYENTTAHLLEELERAETILKRYAELSPDRSLRTGLDVADADGRVSDEGEAVDLDYALPPAALEELRAAEAAIEEKRVHARDHDVELRLENLTEAFGLADNHRDVVSLALLPDVDAGTTELFETLHDEVGKRRPTVGLLADLFAETPAEFVTALELFGPDSPLVERNLVVLDPPAEGAAPSTLEYTVRLDDRIRSYLLGQDGVDPALQAHLAEHAPGDVDEHLAVTGAEATLDGLPVGEDLRAELAALPDADGRGRRVYLYGPRGAGHHRAVEALCDVDRYLQADLRAVLAGDALDDARREILHVHTQSTPLGDGVDLDALADRTAGYVGADVEALCREASMESAREFLDESSTEGPDSLESVYVELAHFERALENVHPSVDEETERHYESLEAQFGRTDTSADDTPEFR